MLKSLTRKKKKKKNELLDITMFFICFYIVMQNGNLYHVIPTKVGI